MTTHWIIRKASSRRWLLLYVSKEQPIEQLFSHYHTRTHATKVAHMVAYVGDTIQVEK
ncbi:hypothetical protein UFOVP63_46 [uncultured Caudovirales phage]|uniref:Uncharacterized protein n=1 Tax=uncultured Caudovirales phage TaxID=2100421 RepID=A0A6J5KVQ7_9CAUD|nr:hypothetical protein UFOVP63_46 [uncultured Caudovirales phage]